MRAETGCDERQSSGSGWEGVSGCPVPGTMSVASEEGKERGSEEGGREGEEVGKPRWFRL